MGMGNGKVWKEKGVVSHPKQESGCAIGVTLRQTVRETNGRDATTIMQSVIRASTGRSFIH